MLQASRGYRCLACGPPTSMSTRRIWGLGPWGDTWAMHGETTDAGGRLLAPLSPTRV